MPPVNVGEGFLALIPLELSSNIVAEVEGESLADSSLRVSELENCSSVIVLKKSLFLRKVSLDLVLDCQLLLLHNLGHLDLLSIHSGLSLLLPTLALHHIDKGQGLGASSEGSSLVFLAKSLVVTLEVVNVSFESREEHRQVEVPDRRFLVVVCRREILCSESAKVSDYKHFVAILGLLELNAELAVRLNACCVCIVPHSR